MNGRKVIAVVGATGAHGGGLVRAILNDPKGDFSARVLTTDVNGAGAMQKSSNLRCNFRDELQAARPLTDESQSLDRSHWPTCSIASSTSGNRPAPKMKLCCPSETECTIICLAYSRTDVS